MDLYPETIELLKWLEWSDIPYLYQTHFTFLVTQEFYKEDLAFSNEFSKRHGIEIRGESWAIREINKILNKTKKTIPKRYEAIRRNIRLIYHDPIRETAIYVDSYPCIVRFGKTLGKYKEYQLGSLPHEEGHAHYAWRGGKKQLSKEYHGPAAEWRIIRTHQIPALKAFKVDRRIIKYLLSLYPEGRGVLPLRP